MKRLIVLQWFRNISIKRKLYFAVGIMAFLIAFELLTLWFAIHALSSVRAYVEGEGLWSKSEKDAIYHLQKYTQSRNENDYKVFTQFIAVPEGDHITRMELMKQNPDWQKAREGFVAGRNHPDDVDGMINLFRRFHRISYINRAIVVWGEADDALFKLLPLADQLHSEISSANPSEARIMSLYGQVEALNEQLTVLEDEFSYTLGEGSRWLEHVVLRLLFVVALTVEISGLILTISVSRSIQKGLDEILRASRQIAKGNFNIRAKSFSEDEIGTLAKSFNHMADELEESTRSLKDYANKLEQSNDSLEQFAYVASHDLQEPLRTITNFTGLLEQKLNGTPDKESKHYMNRVINAANRMKTMVHDILDYSRIGKHREIEQVDCNKIINEVLLDMTATIKENEAKIIFDSLPVVRSSKSEVRQLFQNLINNAIKYRRPDVPPSIEIQAEKNDFQWIFSVKDNGIGIDPAYKAKIFVIFKRLHNHDEYSGTGIGLATCKKIIELNGGKIWLESLPGEGTTFYFSLPNYKN